MWQVLKMFIRQVNLLLVWPPRAGSFSSTHLKKVLSERVRVTVIGCNNVTPRGEVTDTLLLCPSEIHFSCHFSSSILVVVLFACLFFFFGR